jgi:hypothetical protein
MSLSPAVGIVFAHREPVTVNGGGSGGRILLECSSRSARALA